MHHKRTTKKKGRSKLTPSKALAILTKALAVLAALAQLIEQVAKLIAILP